MEIFRVFGSIFVENDKANKALDTTDTKAKGVGGTLGSVIGTAAKVGAAVVAAGAAAGTALLALSTKAAATTDRIDKLSQKIGLSREGFQEWEFILSQNGASIESMQTGLKTLVQRMDEAARGSGKGGELLARLGVAAQDATGKLRSQEEVFTDTVRALQAMPDGADKARLATELFGKAGLELMPLLNGAAGGVDELKSKARELGLILSDDAIDAGVQFTDTMDQLKRSLGSVFTQVGVSLMPMFQRLAAWVIEHMPEIQSVITTVIGAISRAVSWLAEAIIPLLVKGWEWFRDTVVPLLQQFWAVIQELWDRYGAYIVEGLQSACRQISIVLETAFGVIRGIFDFFLALLRGDWKGAWDAIKGIVVTVWTGIKNFFGEIWEGIKKAFKGPIDTVTGWIQGFIDWVDNLIDRVRKGIDWVKNLLGLNREAAQTTPEATKPQVAATGSLPEFATGGVVPGPFGRPQLAVVHGGEEVLTPEERASRSRPETLDTTLNATYYVTDRATAEYANADLLRRLRNLGVTG